MPIKIHNKKQLKPLRKKLRNHGTTAEALLWNELKGKKTGRKFRRQHSIENFIVDFYCAEERLIIELDGARHNNPGIIIKDEDRNEQLLKAGYTLLRFENSSVINKCESVIEVIKASFKQ